MLFPNIDPLICNWLNDFLSDRQQSIRINGITSSKITLNTGAPQGCVLLPLLFTLYTNNCQSSSTFVNLFTFSDDSTLQGLISNNDESFYRNEVSNLVSWCNNNNLILNVSKTKELVIDFRRDPLPLVQLQIDGQTVEVVNSFKFLGTFISNDLKWETNTTFIIKKCHQRLFFLRKLKKFGLDKTILIQFYRAVIESVLTFSVTTWYGSLNASDIERIDKIVFTSSKIIGASLDTVTDIYNKRVAKKVSSIRRYKDHPANNLFTCLPSGRRFRSILSKTDRFKNSFYVRAMREVCP